MKIASAKVALRVRRTTFARGHLVKEVKRPARVGLMGCSLVVVLYSAAAIVRLRLVDIMVMGEKGD